MPCCLHEGCIFHFFFFAPLGDSTCITRQTESQGLFSLDDAAGTVKDSFTSGGMPLKYWVIQSLSKLHVFMSFLWSPLLRFCVRLTLATLQTWQLKLCFILKHHAISKLTSCQSLWTSVFFSGSVYLFIYFLLWWAHKNLISHPKFTSSQ